MKRILSTGFLVFLFSILQAQPNIELSFTGSPSLNWMSSDTKEVQKGQPVLGYDFGVNVDYYVAQNEQYSISTGIFITNAGGQLEFNTQEQFRFADEYLEPSTKVKYYLRYIEVPALIKMKTSQFHRTTFWGQFGLSGMVNIGAKGTSNDEVLDKTNISDEVNMFNLALNVGLGFEFDLGGNNAFTTGLVFKNGFLDVTSNDDIDDKTIMNSLVLKLGIVF
ncbi:MAG: hypothetical protein A2W90_20740 [Bacteroidetes bacterium GWF2_42_66]|nr:MAG: hypothetical protein A2W92_12585 [Bacteroidetes bacterium GWA2_42_15]OFX99171.1 MAG: hypothetical protein A2W89_03420 [Bacteroidetes bacterium GWE2_42_39]OFY40567.1 MAG: hypothetical protein A2W90_20740 [Bacteroidetes bacterium GWF2_42_66]HBL74518.1 hypothetical protein [Prolixibacteraceae bacterium]HCR90357.1 hypothetical protein [Prolixibacteraceae bacterium]